MYFLLAGVMDKFHLLKYGLAFVLAFVGVKMLLPLLGAMFASVSKIEDPHWHMDPMVSLAVILGALTLSVTASLLIPIKHDVHGGTHGKAKQESGSH